MTAPHTRQPLGIGRGDRSDTADRARPVQGRLALPSLDPALTVAHAAVDRERAAERRVVDEKSGATARPSSIPPATAGPSSAGIASRARPSRQPRAARRARRRGRPATRRRPARAAPPSPPIAAAHRLGEQLQLGVDREPHAPSSASTASVSAPSSGRGPRLAGIGAVDAEDAAEHRHRPEPRLRHILDQPVGAHLLVGMDRLARRAPGRPERRRRRAARATPRREPPRSPRSIAAVSRCFAGEHRRIGGNEVGRLDRRIVEPEQRQQGLAAAPG